MTGIDRLMYGGDSLGIDYQRNSNIPNEESVKKMGESNRKDSDFQQMVRNKLDEKIKPDKKYHLSSSSISRNLTREDVLGLVKHNKNAAKLYEAAREFEAYFVEHMFREMKKNVPKNKLIHGGRAEEIFDDLLLTERVRQVSSQSQFGMAENMFQQLQGF